MYLITSFQNCSLDLFDNMLFYYDTFCQFKGGIQNFLAQNSLDSLFQYFLIFFFSTSPYHFVDINTAVKFIYSFLKSLLGVSYGS